MDNGKFSRTLTLSDAQRISGPRAFNIMLKPAGSLCNLDCNYCYYLDKASIYGGREPRMSIETLERVVREYIAANDVPEVFFNWHGGEPLVLGLDFYRKAVEFELKYANGKTIHNTIQTNGTLLDNEWIDFLCKNNFLVGISIDGPMDIHDRYRKDKGKNGSFNRVIKGIELLRDGGVEFNTMSTINKASEGRGLEVYQFLKSIGSRYMQFMPVVEHVKYPCDSKGKEIRNARPYIVDPSEEDAKIAPWSISDIGFGRFLCDIFDYWVRNDVSVFYVNQFDSALANWCHLSPGTCAYAETCGGNAVIEHNGDIYPCDHFVYPKYLLGNLTTNTIASIMDRSEMLTFGISKRNTLPSKCRKCEWLFACNGECPKHRFNHTDGGETGLNALCEGYRLFYSHIAPYMDYMKNLLMQRKSPSYVIPWARARKI